MSENSVDAAMRQRVQRQLADIEQRYKVRVLYACESGSRGWGFASPDSDYDVRFLYVHQPEWYLRVEAQRDVIELPIDDELDVCGWEWRKALGLLKAANPTLIEWLDSPVVYQQDASTVAALKALVPQWFSPLRARWHYYSMARKNFRGYLQGEQVRLKKYFYVLRPLLAVRWVEAGKGVPPMRFSELLAGSELEPALRNEIDELLVRKQRAGEAEYGIRRPLLHAFIQHELARGEVAPELPDSRTGRVEQLDRLLMSTVLAP
ncbi:nucleotidyltransferase domain-containing protein [Klebsiella aerogenes]|uniref:nucleotidyltransferase domain-containing protein n=1 Tax=Klebsiella TaxID=570 RepID=UPI0005F03DEF|nr:nucleotidyltransferase domain-containing protein [Klebsiella aerogenes]EJC6255995.1 nucleotidyltransferase domain-containing protein [Klebsiella aerogenes]EKL0985427.1 nucleotidyltransferase domain-containing protein [Klebsiella aerogenes]EKT8948704.1 nucleotidyltransferase domain-containing protein [Klebsiella aerogenes]EKU6159005.1 nucleotidyltransferase domain-containing protein [Klebsiella aerogenes]EKV8599732.1 nucleotidyltransferase domain-containing protein [Klebsiella aerogenes]